MDEIKIESNVPIPSARFRGAGYHDAIKKLKPTQSFWLPKTAVGTSFQTGAYKAAKEIGVKVSVRRVAQDGVEGWRVWRVQ